MQGRFTVARMFFKIFRDITVKFYYLKLKNRPAPTKKDLIKVQLNVANGGHPDSKFE